MEICLFTDSFLPRIGGMELVIHHIANALSEIGCKITVIAKRAKRLQIGTEIKREYDLVYYGYNFPFSWRMKADFLSGLLALMSENKNKQFDIINCHSVSYAGLIAAFAKKIIDVPLVMTPHGKDVQKVPEIKYGVRLEKKWERIVRRNLAAADAVTAISDAITKDISFLDEDKIFAVPNGIDTKKFNSQKSHFLQDYLSLDPTKKIILSVGRNHIKKGYEYGIRCLKSLYSMNLQNNFIYIIIGKDTNKLEPVVSNLSLEGKVYLLPETDRESILKSYQSAWCFFSPSIVEGLSLVSIEAMATGLPLIVTDVPGNMDIVRDNQCGIIVKNRDPQSMAEGIEHLNRNANLYQQLSRTAIEKVKHYDWSNIAKMYLNVYQKAGYMKRNISQ